MKIVLILAIAGLAACTNQNIPLPTVQADDPVWQLNADRWSASVNDLMTPPGDGSPHPLPSPVITGSNEVPTL